MDLDQADEAVYRGLSCELSENEFALSVVVADVVERGVDVEVVVVVRGKSAGLFTDPNDARVGVNNGINGRVGNVTCNLYRRVFLSPQLMSHYICCISSARVRTVSAASVLAYALSCLVALFHIRALPLAINSAFGQVRFSILQAFLLSIALRSVMTPPPAQESVSVFERATSSQSNHIQVRKHLLSRNLFRLPLQLTNRLGDPSISLSFSTCLSSSPTLFYLYFFCQCGI
jgi:hypothetical protein